MKLQLCMCTFVMVTVRNESCVRDDETGHVVVWVKLHKPAK